MVEAPLSQNTSQDQAHPMKDHIARLILITLLGSPFAFALLMGLAYANAF